MDGTCHSLCWPLMVYGVCCPPKLCYADANTHFQVESRDCERCKYDHRLYNEAMENYNLELYSFSMLPKKKVF